PYVLVAGVQAHGTNVARAHINDTFNDSTQKRPLDRWRRFSACDLSDYSGFRILCVLSEHHGLRSFRPATCTGAPWRRARADTSAARAVAAGSTWRLWLRLLPQSR